MSRRFAFLVSVGLIVASAPYATALADDFIDTGTDTFSVAPPARAAPPAPPPRKEVSTAIAPLPAAGLSTVQRRAERAAAATIQALDGSNATEGATINLRDDCGPLFVDESWETRNNLLSYKTVFGKPALDWNDDDYRKVISLARSCSGQSFHGKSVDGNNWSAMVEFAFHAVLPVALVARKVDDFALDLHTKDAKLPRCPRLLDFVHDDWAMTDNSEGIFGISLMRMSGDDLDKTVQYANQCLLYLPGYALAAKGLRQDDTMVIVNGLMDKALLILKRRQDYDDKEKWPHLDTDLVLTIEGAKVMPTMTSQACREMIERYNRASASRRKFTPEMVSTLVRLSDQVLTDNLSAYDKAYAEAVQGKVQQMIFRRGD